MVVASLFLIPNYIVPMHRTRPVEIHHLNRPDQPLRGNFPLPQLRAQVCLPSSLVLDEAALLLLTILSIRATPPIPGDESIADLPRMHGIYCLVKPHASQHPVLPKWASKQHVRDTLPTTFFFLFCLPSTASF